MSCKGMVSGGADVRFSAEMLDAVRRLSEEISRLGKAIAYHAEEAKKRQGQRTDLENIQELVPRSYGQARDKAGAVFGVSGRSVDGARRDHEALTATIRARRWAQGRSG